MTLLTWLPEVILLFQLLWVVALMNFKPFTYRSLPLWVSFVSLFSLVYFCFRTDLSHFDSPIRILSSDSLSYFGRLFSLLLVAIGALYVHFHPKLTFNLKNKAILFLLFLALFLNISFLSQSLIFLLVGWAGAYVSVTNFVLIESGNDDSWIKLVRDFALPLSLTLVLFLMIFVLSSVFSSGIYISDFISWVPHDPSPSTVSMCLGGLILLLGVILLHGFVSVVEAPFGFSLFCIFNFLMNSIYWLKLGVPFFNESAIVPKNYIQLALGLNFGWLAIRHSIAAVRTRERYAWLSGILNASVGMGLFFVVLKMEHALSLFYILSLAFLFTFFFAGQAFLETGKSRKLMVILGVLTLIGLPPLVMGEQYFRLIHFTLEAGLLPLSLVIGISWFLLSVAIIQMLNQVITAKDGPVFFKNQPRGELILIIIYLLCVIALTALKPTLVELLNTHPVRYLW